MDNIVKFWRLVHERETGINLFVLTPTGISVLKGDVVVCGDSPCSGVISLQAAAGAPVDIPWIGTRIDRRTLTTAQENTIFLLHDMVLTVNSNWALCSPGYLYQSAQLRVAWSDWFILFERLLSCLLYPHRPAFWHYRTLCVWGTMGEMDFESLTQPLNFLFAFISSKLFLNVIGASRL